MSDDNKPQVDPAVEAELKGVPEELLEGGEEQEETVEDALALLRNDLEAAKQEVLYAKAETQNVRRRMEKDVADARTYAATGFARDILSVSDNLSRALDAIPAELREDDKVKTFIAGIEATARELDKVFGLHGISRIAAVGLPLDQDGTARRILAPHRKPSLDKILTHRIKCAAARGDLGPDRGNRLCQTAPGELR